MTGGFRRTVSFPSPPCSSAAAAAAAAKRSAYKVRCASLPVRFHPIISNLDDDVATLRSWSSSIPSPQPRSATWLSDGVGIVSLVLASLLDLLCHPQAADPLRNSPITDLFLDDLMRLADAHNSFRISLINFSHLQAETRAALRRRDSARLASAVRAQRHAGRDIVRLASVAKTSVRTRPPLSLGEPISPDSTGVAMLPAAICDAAFALAAASAELISGLVALSEEATAPVAPVIATAGPVKLIRIWWVVDLLRWKGRARKRALERRKSGKMEGRMEREEMERKVAMEKLEGLEKCIKVLESGSEKFFRALVNARVSVLNILTPSI